MKNISKKSFVLVVAVIMILLFCSSCTTSITTTDVIYSPDGKYSLEATRCIGACGLAPVLTINNEVYGKLVPADMPAILEKYK